MTGLTTFVAGHVIAEDLARRTVQRNLTGPIEFGSPLRQCGGAVIDIPKLDIACFGQTVKTSA